MKFGKFLFEAINTKFLLQAKFLQIFYVLLKYDDKSVC